MPEIGQTLSHYRILEKIGVGGMGEVYLADDLSLDRKVALKFLPDVFTGDPERMARFEREAKLLASLNHPNIAAIYGLEQADGKRFLIMEYVEGETLQARISKGALPLDEALGVCRQIAEGLEAAHEKGVIHRDLKPANVMITGEEKVKILDFGLAKALLDEGQSVDSSQSPTITEAMTQPGVVLGTAAYMSPEQAKGKAADKRADIWAFGCILYECLTGRRVFEGETVTETLAAILRGEPNWKLLPDSTPQNIRFVLRRCLEKEKNGRLESSADVRILLEEQVASSATSESVRSQIPRVFIAILIFIGLLAGSGITYIWQWLIGTPVKTAQPMATYIAAPGEVVSAFHKGFALSPDGQTLIFSARTADGHRQIWKRQLDDPRAQPMAGTDNGTHPFWSPDGRQIAFFASDELKRMPAEGGQVQTICILTNAMSLSGSWSENGVILFSAVRGSMKAIFHVSADGGSPELVPGLGDEGADHPQWLPGGRLFLFCRTVGGRSGSIFAASIDDTVQPAKVVDLDVGFEGVNVAFFFSPSGHLLFNSAGALTVQQFDPETLSVIGKAVPIAGLVGTPKSWFALSSVGDVVAMLAPESRNDHGNPGDPLTRLKWLNRRGEIVGELGPSGRYWALRLSPDGTRAAVNPDHDIWILDSENHRTHVTSRPGLEYSATWSPNGTKFAFSHMDSASVFLKSAIQGGQETELFSDPSRWLRPVDWSRDGKYLLLDCQATRESTSSDIWLYDFSEKSTKPWLETEFNESHARFSPDGSWVAYTSNANGTAEVFLRSFKGAGSAIPVSSSGGSHPAWRSDGQELFYISSKDELMAVDVTKVADALEVGQPQYLFKVAMNDLASEQHSPFDVTPNGQRFLVNLPEAPEPILLIQRFEKLLQRGQ